MNTARPQRGCHGSIRKMPEEKLFSDARAPGTNTSEHNETVPREADWREAKETKTRVLQRETKRKRGIE